MLIATASILVVWAALLGTAWLTRGIARWSRRAAAVAVTVCYAGLALAALSWLGHGRSGLIGIAGMLLPYSVALVLLAVAP